MSPEDGTGNLYAMPGIMARSWGYGAARHVALKRDASAPIWTGTACAVEFSQV